VRQTTKYLYLFSLSLIAAFLLSSCGPTYKLKEGNKILRSKKVKFKGPIPAQERNNYKKNLDYLYPQKSNSYILGIVPYRSYLYNLRHKKYERDSFNFQIINGIVEKPYIYEEDLWENFPDLMKQYIQNQGYFHAEVVEKIKENPKKVRLKYEIHSGNPFLIGKKEWESFPKELEKYKNALDSISTLEYRRKYTHEQLEIERNTIINYLKNQGYYALSLEHIYFDIDTIHSEESVGIPEYLNTVPLAKFDSDTFQTVDIYMHFNSSKTNIPDSIAYQKYKIDEVTIYGDYIGFGKIDLDSLNKTEFLSHLYYFGNDYLQIEVIDRHLFLRKGQYYSEDNYNKTLRELSDLGVFKQSSIKLNPISDSSLSVTIFLEPMEKYDFQTSIELSGGDLYTVGSSLQLYLINKNFLKGANRLSARLSYGLELEQNKQLSNSFWKQFFFYSQNVGLNFKLEFPKFLLPINPERFSRNALPTTSIDLGANYLERFQYFKLLNISSALQYEWSANKHLHWKISPAYINLLYLLDVDKNFQLRMDSIPAIKNAYQETFIHGERIELQYLRENRSNFITLKFGIEEAGFLTQLVNNIAAKDVLKTAQFLRFDWEAKWQKDIGRSKWLNRFHGGIGWSYGRSTVMPYIKQFYVGGPYSIRGWLPRNLGPGSYNVENYQQVIDYLYMDQAGDIKLEWNTEYRFPLVQLFKGSVKINAAAFVDAGNIWLMQEDDKLPGAKFKWNELGQDIAISTGAGLRLDLGGIFVVRLDWGFPIKKPYLMENYGWTINNINFSSKSWRKENLNLNIAIGYPF